MLGHVAPSGRLPFTWARSMYDAGNITNYTMLGSNKTYRYEQPWANQHLY